VCVCVALWGSFALASLLVNNVQTGAPSTCRTPVVFAALMPAKSSPDASPHVVMASKPPLLSAVFPCDAGLANTVGCGWNEVRW
jgi:hypothetical protein